MKKTIKNLLFALTIVFATTISFAQEIKGFTFKASSYANSNDNYETIYNTYQMFNVSLTDGVAVHNILNEDGDVTDSQFYKVKSYSISNDNIEYVIKFTLVSGISGREYKYSLHISNDYEILNLSDGLTLFVGSATKLKTFKQ
jgi:hypothetical protein